MTYANLRAFYGDWKYESEKTAAMLRSLTDASLAQRVGPEDRTLGRIAWRLVQTIPEMLNRTGLGLAEVHGPVPGRAAEIAAAYEKASADLVRGLKARWKSADLRVEDEMYGERWKRGLTLACLLLHQVHHRGQMTVLMRQAGLRVPGVYGPSREEWAAMGAPAPEV